MGHPTYFTMIVAADMITVRAYQQSCEIEAQLRGLECISNSEDWKVFAECSVSAGIDVTDCYCQIQSIYPQYSMFTRSFIIFLEYNSYHNTTLLHTIKKRNAQSQA